MPAKDKEIPLVDSSDDEEIREEVILQKENAKPEIEIADAWNRLHNGRKYFWIHWGNNFEIIA